MHCSHVQTNGHCTRGNIILTPRPTLHTSCCRDLLSFTLTLPLAHHTILMITHSRQAGVQANQQRGGNALAYNGHQVFWCTTTQSLAGQTHDGTARHSTITQATYTCQRKPSACLCAHQAQAASSAPSANVSPTVTAQQSDHTSMPLLTHTSCTHIDTQTRNEKANRLLLKVC